MPGEILVQFNAGLDAGRVQQVLATVGGTALEVVHGDAAQGEALLLRVGLPPEAEAEEAITLLRGEPAVAFAEANFTVSVEAVSNDGGYVRGNLWGMYGDATEIRNANGSQAGEAWATGATGSASIVVGVLDTGLNYTHSDIYQNVWINQNEIPVSLRGKLADTDSDGQITFRDLNQAANKAWVKDLNKNGRIDAGDLLKDSSWVNGDDLDRNGYRDDLFGWDFVNDDNDPFDDHGHGTHVSGTIGAMGGNGYGVAGVAWDVQIVALKFLGASGSGSIADAVKALDYYTAAGKAAVGQDFVATNNSWGGGAYSSAMQQAIDRSAEAGNLFIAAAGNNGRNTDAAANYPSGYSTLGSVGYEAVVSVAAITSTGARASYSNYGATSVDLGAPGSSIHSIAANGGYTTMSGTSMAAPHVTGAIALYAAANPEDSAAEIRSALLNATTATASLEGRTVTGGRLDVARMLEIGAAPDAEPEQAAPEPEPEPILASFIFGTAGSDNLVGTAGVDTISGIAATGNTLGKGSVDVLWGLAGDDVFLLGDARGVFYDDGLAAKQGTGDYARIMDFAAGDRIQLSDDVDTYFLRKIRVDGQLGTAIYADLDGNNRYGTTDELIGHVVGSATLSAADFIYG
nr:S8 family peptidase [Falsiroseomonas selenitidurans]